MQDRNKVVVTFAAMPDSEVCIISPRGWVHHFKPNMGHHTLTVDDEMRVRWDGQPVKEDEVEPKFLIEGTLGELENKIAEIKSRKERWDAPKKEN